MILLIARGDSGQCIFLNHIGEAGLLNPKLSLDQSLFQAVGCSYDQQKPEAVGVLISLVTL